MLHRKSTICQHRRLPSMSLVSVSLQPPRFSSRSTLKGDSRHCKMNLFWHSFFQFLLPSPVKEREMLQQLHKTITAVCIYIFEMIEAAAG
ncbi:unnamed protein product [Linum tenue]|uniref:Uncharacterized protein n=1 Tax=Linum tenue TaxID=586396 RepID=A0AAV0Q060_9ROSI|nr:unnamed protein product [Linum tenue]